MKKSWFTTATPVMTITMCILIVIAAGVGGAVVIWGDPGTLSFKEYLNDLKWFAGAVAITAVGRGVADGLKSLK